MHPEIGTIGERGHFHRKMLAKRLVGSTDCSCGKPFAECEFWQQVKEQLVRNVPAHLLTIPFSGFRLYNAPRPILQLVEKLCLTYALRQQTDQLPFPLRQRFAQVQAANRILIQAVLATSGKTHFLDASKSEKDALFLSSLPNFQLYIIHLLRDGRGQVASTIKHHPQQTVESAGTQWVKRIHSQQKLLRHLAVLPIHYEQLCAQPLPTLQTILTFCGLEPTIPSLNFRQNPIHIMGNPMRLQDSAEIQDKQEWRTQLTAKQLDSFEQIAGTTNRSLGYR